MGANNTRRVSFEADENQNITVVKGIRLSENVIKRMREPEEPPKKQQPPTPPPPAPTVASSLLRPVPPLFDPITSLPPLLPSPVEAVEPTPPPPPPPVHFVTETVPPPPPPPVEQVASLTIPDTVPPADPAAAAAASAFEPVAASPPPPPAADAAPAVETPDSSLASQPAELIAAPPLLEFTAPSEPVAPPLQPKEEPVFSAPVPKSEPVPEPSPVPVAPLPPPPTPPVDEEALRKTITEELNQGFKQDRAKAEQELQAWLESEKARVSASAQAEAQSQVQDEVSRILSVERAVAQESVQQAIIKERITTEDEKRRAQLFAKQLEAREADLKKQDVFYREQVARLEERSVQFYKVTTENYHKAADDINSKFRRYEMYPVCTDLQGQILACYKENVGKTLNCSSIAALYLQCVNNAKQNKLRTGG
ncbi:coiled-coil-helix-coiled-coil-helix domain containing 3a isoform X1 [Gouania willdenowi]|uniref:coiled-coil-helix-coiled-coil-helix domain containing 3a isoform X1 n=1 Tax=Gouania willdenowi TaxID=441366 RepID=UPI0010561A9E|nr:MICOS complex subunit MIC19 isoform X1 [Gouania willdenowi]